MAAAEVVTAPSGFGALAPTTPGAAAVAAAIAAGAAPSPSGSSSRTSASGGDNCAGAASEAAATDAAAPADGETASGDDAGVAPPDDEGDFFELLSRPERKTFRRREERGVLLPLAVGGASFSVPSLGGADADVSSWRSNGGDGVSDDAGPFGTPAASAEGPRSRPEQEEAPCAGFAEGASSRARG